MDQNLNLDIKFYASLIIEILLKNLNGSKKLKKELEEMKKKYCTNIIN